MSLELLPTLEKDVVSKNKTSTDKSAEPKKEGGSLFDSLMKDALNEAPSKKSTISEKAKQISDKNDNISAEKQPKIDTSSKKIEEQETPIKKMVNSLVEIVVDKSKEKDLVKNTDSKKTTKLLVVEEEPKVKVNIEKNVATLKQSAQELSEIVKPVKDGKILEAKETQKEAVEKKLEKAEQKVVVIEKATTKIKEEIQKAVSNEPVKTDPKEMSESKTDKTTVLSLESQSEENKSVLGQKVEQKVQIITQTVKEIKEDISTKEKAQLGKKVEVTTKVSTKELGESIEQKVEIITNAADDIQKEVEKVVFVSSDQLIKKIQEFKNPENNSIEKKKIVIVPSSKNMQDGDDTKLNDKNSVLSNSFLMAQKQEKQQVSMKNIHDAKKNIEENKTIGAVKQSANALELNPEEIEIEHVGEKGESKSELFAKHNKQVQEQFYQNKSLNKMVIDQQRQKEMINDQVQKQTVETKNIQESEDSSTKQKEATVSLNVPSHVAETIQSRIIGAHQRVGSFMSEVARNMYLNYKPPFTSFRMNLNPGNLGTISIVMRANNSDNNLSVSMNMSSNATMDSFVENKAALQNALQRQLGEGSNVTLNFGMQNGNDSQSFDSNMGQSQSNNSNNTQNDESEGVTQNIIEQEEVSETLNYM